VLEIKNLIKDSVMKLIDLFNKLEELDKSKEINFFSFIEIGRGGSWIEVEDCRIEEEDGVYILKISGSEDEDGGYE